MTSGPTGRDDRARRSTSGGRGSSTTGSSKQRTGGSERGGGDGTPWYRRRWALALIVPALLVVSFGALAALYLFTSIPLPEDVGAAPTVVVDRNGTEVGTLSAQAARQDIDLEAMPEHVQQTVMAAEDRTFLEHSGVSLTGTVRALFVNTTAGEIQQGGSTITQQYIKNALVGNERSFVRKAKEAVLALKLERRYEKQHIMELYLNSIYWGRGAYGVEAAARTYFGKGAAELSLNEAATLAGIIQAPENLDPREVPEDADARRRYVLDGMLEKGWIDQSAYDAAVAEGLPSTSERASVEYGEGAYYLDAVRRTLAAELGDEEVYRGLRVVTEMDLNAQRIAERVMKESLADQPFTGALVSIDPADGGVRALVGGPDYAAQQFNTAVRSARQPGSSFKPFTLAAFVEDGYSPESRLDAPATIAVPDGNGGQTEVKNYDGKARGTQTAREATWSSTNTVYVQLQEAVGTDKVVDAAHDLGIPEDRELPAVPVLTLGVGSVTPVDMASAYATLAAGGVYTEPRLILEVRDAEGTLVLGGEPERKTAMPANDAYIVTDVLRGVIANGTGTAADIGRPAAGKTGTTSDYKDAWFTGYVPQLATAVWIGKLDNTPMEQITGGSVPAQTWAAYMAAVLEGVEAKDFPAPDLSDKEILNELPEPAPSPAPSPSPSPSPSPCPEGDVVGEVVDDVTGGDAGDEPCPAPSPTPSPSSSPSPSPDETTSPSPSPTEDADGGSEPSPSETTEPSPSETSEPSPTAEPSPSPTTSETSGDGG